MKIIKRFILFIKYLYSDIDIPIVEQQPKSIQIFYRINDSDVEYFTNEFTTITSNESIADYLLYTRKHEVYAPQNEWIEFHIINDIKSVRFLKRLKYDF